MGVQGEDNEALFLLLPSRQADIDYSNVSLCNLEEGTKHGMCDTLVPSIKVVNAPGIYVSEEMLYD